MIFIDRFSVGLMCGVCFAMGIIATLAIGAMQ